MTVAQGIRPAGFMLVMLLVMLLMPQGVSAAEADVGDTAENTLDAAEPVAPTEEKEVTPAPGPETDRLRNRNLGKALEQFTPSEAISADNAVPFPIDI